MSSHTASPEKDADRPRGSKRSLSRRTKIAVGALLLLVLLGGGSALLLRSALDPGAAVTGVTEVTLRNDAFHPAAIEVPAGTTVTWRWDGQEQHNVVGDGFQSPTQVDGEFAHTFSEPGTYAYRCTLHFLMRGEVIVD